MGNAGVHWSGIMNDRLRIWHSWKHILNRCLKPQHPSYSLYGGRGIRVCERWCDQTKIPLGRGGRPHVKGFLNFLEDMEDTWFLHASIDRINNDGDYTPENCQWLSRKENTGKMSRSRVSNRTHHFLGGHITRERVKNKTHNFMTNPVTKNTIWINNGIVNKRLQSNQDIPSGFEKGMIKPRVRIK